MFTGIIRGIGEITDKSTTGGDVRLTISSADLDFETYEEGESIAVSGVCLTALSLKKGTFVADVSRETLAVTTLGDICSGARVNLEPSLALGDRLGGHLVTGHVDCIGRIVSRTEDARSVRLGVSVEPPMMRYIARKGSVAVDGISLTVNSVDDAAFDVNIIPHTMRVTTLSDVKVGDTVNIEVDLMARYLERFFHAPDEGALTAEFLERHGYGL